MLFAVGEGIQSPRYYEYVAALAPKEQVGTYMGFAFLPIAIGTFIAGWSSGFLVKTYVVGGNPQAPRMWLWVGAYGVVSTIAAAALRPLRGAAPGRVLSETSPVDYRDLAAEILKAARSAGADAADMVVSEGTEFSVTVRKGEVETLTEAGSKALGLRVFVGQAHGLDLHLGLLLADARAARSTRWSGWRAPPARTPRPGLPDEMVPPEEVELGLFDPSPLELPPAERIERARRAEAAALEVPGIVNSQGASWGSGEGSIAARQRAPASWAATARRRSRSRSCRRPSSDGQMERDHWYTAGRGLADLESPGAGGPHRRRADAAAARRAPGEDGRGAGGVRSRDARPRSSARCSRRSPATPCSATPRS